MIHHLHMVGLLPVTEQVHRPIPTVKAQCRREVMEAGHPDILHRGLRTDKVEAMGAIRMVQVPRSNHVMGLLDMVAWGGATVRKR